MRRRELLAALGGVGLPTVTAAEEGAASESDDSGQTGADGVLEQRQVLILAGTLLTLVGLGLLAAKIRAAEPGTVGTDQVDGALERRDLMEGGEANNLLEEVIRIGNTRRAYAVVITGLFGIGSVLALAGIRDGFAVISFAFVLFAMMAFLRFGWPHIEALHGGEAAEEAGATSATADSLRVGALSTDSKVFLTLLVVITLLMLLGILVEASV